MAEEKLFIEASEEDVPSIIALRQRIWDTTYRGVYPDSMIDNFDWDWHREMELLRVHHPAYSVYLVRKDRQDIGYLTINEADVITLQSLYISAEYQRQGIGRQAFDFVKAYCRAHHAASFVCHCVPENLNARSFYEADPALRRAVDTLIDGTVPTDEEQHELYTSLLEGASWHKPDQYFLFYDFDSYKKAPRR